MDGFISDEEAAKLDAEDGFISDADAAALDEGPSALERYGRGALKALPAAGAMFGGAAGTIMGIPSGPGAIATGLGGAGLGMAAGESLKNIGERYIFGDEKTRDDIYAGPAKAAVEGVTYEMGGQVIGALPGALKSGYNKLNNTLASKIGEGLDYAPKSNSEEILNAAKSLGIDDVPKGVTSSNPSFQQTESGLSQSGSFPAIKTRQQYNNYFKGLDDASGKIEGLKSPESSFTIGGNIQKDLSDQINASREPVSKMYDDLVPHMQKIPVNEKVVNKAFGALKRDPKFLTQDGQAILEGYKQIVKRTT